MVAYKKGKAHLSSVAAKMYLPFGENLTNDTGGLSSSENEPSCHERFDGHIKLQ